MSLKSVLAAKQQQLKTKLAEAVDLNEKIATAAAEGKELADEQKSFNKLSDEIIPELETEIKRMAKLVELEAADEGDDGNDQPAPQRKTRDYQPGQTHERALDAKTLGDAVINSERVKRAIESYKSGEGIDKVTLELKNFSFGPSEAKADTTFSTTATGLDTTTIYLPRAVEGYPIQRLTIRDILPVGQTTQSTVKWIKESTFVNDADMVAEEGQKPYSELSLAPASADVKKIAVLQKISDETLADYPMLRSFINTRTVFKVQAKEEQQLLNGTGAGNQIRGILNFSGIQSLAKAAATPTANALNAIYNAITLIRQVMTAGAGGYEPSAIVMHPTDYQNLRLTLDGNNQYYGGGPFSYGPYGSGGFQINPGPWGLPVVVTTAIAAGTALVGDFRNGAQIFQRQGVTVELFNQNVDDVEFNRMTLRVEERLALADFADSAFCKVTGL